MSDNQTTGNQTTADPASLLRHFAQFQGPPVDNAMVAGANEIDRLRSCLDRLVGLDITTREGQSAFAIWQNRHQSEKRQLSQISKNMITGHQTIIPSKLPLPESMRVFVGFNHGEGFTQAEVESNDLSVIAERVVDLRRNEEDCAQAKHTFIHMIDRLGPEYGGPILRDYVRSDIAACSDFDDLSTLRRLVKRAQIFFTVEMAVQNTLADEGLT